MTVCPDLPGCWRPPFSDVKSKRLLGIQRAAQTRCEHSREVQEVQERMKLLLSIDTPTSAHLIHTTKLPNCKTAIVKAFHSVTSTISGKSAVCAQKAAPANGWPISLASSFLLKSQSLKLQYRAIVHTVRAGGQAG